MPQNLQDFMLYSNVESNKKYENRSNFYYLFLQYNMYIIETPKAHMKMLQICTESGRSCRFNYSKDRETRNTNTNHNC